LELHQSDEVSLDPRVAQLTYERSRLSEISPSAELFLPGLCEFLKAFGGGVQDESEALSAESSDKAKSNSSAFHGSSGCLPSTNS
ncbi:MAG: hypothetical protein ACXVBC_03770, partial [Bdellovibrionota bacterium]